MNVYVVCEPSWDHRTIFHSAARSTSWQKDCDGRYSASKSLIRQSPVVANVNISMSLPFNFTSSQLRKA
jgi:hypothetical protein